MAKLLIEGEPDPSLAEILIVGKFQRRHISIGWSSQPFVPNEKQKASMEERWGNNWFNGPLSKVVDASLSRGSLSLNMQPTDFKTYVGTRRNEDLKKFGVNAIANPLSVSLAIRGADGAFVIAQKKTGDRIGSLDAPGGYVNPQKDVSFPRFIQTIATATAQYPFLATPFERFLSAFHRRDVERAAYREYEEETACGRETIASLAALGLQYEHKDLNHPVLSYICQSYLTSEQIIERSKGSDGEVKLVRSFTPLRTLSSYASEGVDIEPDGQFTYALAWLHENAGRKREVTRLPEVICSQTWEESLLARYEATFGNNPPASPQL